MRARPLERTASGSEPGEVPPIVHQVLGSRGQPLDPVTRAFMEPRFGQDFSRVRVHTTGQAVESARALNALAYTVGHDVVFDAGQFQSKTADGRRLLAHELTHVMQQSSQAGRLGQQLTLENGSAFEAEANHNARRVADGNSIDTTQPSMAPSEAVQRQPKTLGTKVTHPDGSKSPYESITANFDGRDFVVYGDNKEIMKISAQSGRSLRVAAADAIRCDGDKEDTYMNNPRYVGVTDNGPIPEGEYAFVLTQMATFSRRERLKMFPGGEFKDPFGAHLHGGDWGAGRVPLKPVSILPSKSCGNTKGRSGFFLHGGMIPGSSGCIDIGNSGIKDLIPLLYGYTLPIHVTVKYVYEAPKVGALKRAMGRYTYPKEKDPTFRDRLRSLFGRSED